MNPASNRKDNPHTGDDRRGAGDAWHVTAARLVTPTGVVAILIALMNAFGGFNDALNRNCNATQKLGNVVAIVAGINTPANASPANHQLLTQLRRQLQSLPDCDS